MAITRTSRLVLWLLLGVVLLIMYGSLYPFHFKTNAIQGGFWQALDQLSWARAGRGDRVSNVLLYLPLGFCLFLSLNRRYRRRISLLLATVLGAVLSLAMEIAQVYVSVRVPSLTDLTLNAAGTLIGAGAGIAWGAIASWMPFPVRTERASSDPGAVVVVGLWLAWRLAPFVPHFDLGKLKAALRPLFDPQFDAVTTFSYLAYWLIVSEALTALVSKPHTLEALLMLIASVLVGRLIVANQTFVADELLALVILLPLLLITMRLAPQPKRWLLLGLLLIAFAIDRLSPLQFTASADNVGSWVGLSQFGASLRDHPWQTLAAIDIVNVFGRLFLFGALVWTLRETGISMTLAVGTMVALVVVCGVVRTALMEGAGAQTPALLTDTLLALLVAATFHYVHRQRRNRTLLARANSRRGRSR
jgi:VanZ family protein